MSAQLVSDYSKEGMLKRNQISNNNHQYEIHLQYLLFLSIHLKFQNHQPKKKSRKWKFSNLTEYFTMSLILSV